MNEKDFQNITPLIKENFAFYAEGAYEHVVSSALMVAYGRVYDTQTKFDIFDSALDICEACAVLLKIKIDGDAKPTKRDALYAWVYNKECYNYLVIEKLWKTIVEKYCIDIDFEIPIFVEYVKLMEDIMQIISEYDMDRMMGYLGMKVRHDKLTNQK